VLIHKKSGLLPAFFHGFQRGWGRQHTPSRELLYHLNLPFVLVDSSTKPSAAHAGGWLSLTCLQMKEHAANDLTLVDAVMTIRVHLRQGFLNCPWRGHQSQPLDGFDQFTVLTGDLLDALAGSPGYPISFSIEQHRLTIRTDAGTPNVETLLLQFQVENRTLTGSMADRWWKHTRLNQDVESAFGEQNHGGHFYDGNECPFGLFWDVHETNPCRFQVCFVTVKTRKEDRKWTVTRWNLDHFGLQTG
jgi:hypothetical protein